MDFLTENIECPICMDIIDLNNNSTKTECGHMFHSSCLMKNIAHNGLTCPYCRNVMAEEPEEVYSDEDDEHFSEGHDEEQDDEEEEVEEVIRVPTINYVAEKLLEQGITFEHLVHMSCNLDHEEFNDFENANIFEDELFGKIRVILSCYQETTDIVPATEPAPETATEPAPETVTEPAPETVTEPAPEPAPETVPEPAPKTVPEPVSEPKTICIKHVVRQANKECID
mgnify:CR=1 FL=1